MKPMEDKGSYNYPSSNDKGSNQRKALGSRDKPTPSKWDDAQKWLVGLSAARDHGNPKSKPRNSDADDLRLIRAMSQKGRNSCSSLDGGLEDTHFPSPIQDEGETKKIDCGESLWRADNPVEDSSAGFKPVYVRDMGTEMTPIASKEPSRATTPLRATTPVLASPIESRSSSPGKNSRGAQGLERYQTGTVNCNGRLAGREEDVDDRKIDRDNGSEQVRNLSVLESRAMAWDEAERAKYMARYKREEMKIQAWENHEKRKAELEMKKIEVKAERLKSRAQERLVNKLTATRRMAEEKRANAESELNELAARTTEKAEYIRRTGHLPSPCFSFKLPSFCS